MPKLTGAKPVPGERPHTSNVRIIGHNNDQAARDLGMGGTSPPEERIAKAINRINAIANGERDPFDSPLAD